MEFERLVFSGHAVQRMFERGIQVDDVRAVLATGEVIAEYPDDRPYPSRLILGWVGERPLHVVAALDSTSGACYVVTVYVPDPGQWSADYRTRRRR
ncbi:MAG: DUF4258 domain-containing protein [Chloroflexota bacterium]